MHIGLIKEFLISKDSLWVYKNGKLLFSSRRDGLLPLLEYINMFSTGYTDVEVFDKVIGNAAALLCIKANCCEVYSPVASQLAVKTLYKHGIKYHLDCIVPYIKQKSSEEMCPMERLSIDKNSDEFYKIMMSKVQV